MQPNVIFTCDAVTLKTVEASDLPLVQSILDHAPYYHTTIVQNPPSGLAERCFYAETPEVPHTRVFKHFFLIRDLQFGEMPVATLDLFVGFPNYQTASVAMLVIREEYQRKGLGQKLLTHVIPAFLREHHPAVAYLSVSLTENNVPGLHCLLKSQYERTNRWEKLDIKGRPIVALTYRCKLSDLDLA